MLFDNYLTPMNPRNTGSGERGTRVDANRVFIRTYLSSQENEGGCERDG